MEYIISHYGTTINKYHRIFYTITNLLMGLSIILGTVIGIFAACSLLAYLFHMDVDLNRQNAENCPGLELSSSQCNHISTVLYKFAYSTEALRGACDTQMKILKQSEPWGAKCTMTFTYTYKPHIIDYMFYLITLTILSFVLVAFFNVLDNTITEVRSRFNISRV